VLTRFVQASAADDRIVAAFLRGSHARGEADEFSDLDLGLITTDESYEDVAADRAAFVRRLGEPLFLEDFGLEGIVFATLADGTELELSFAREGGLDEIDEGQHRTLLDKTGILEGVTFREYQPHAAEQVEELRRILFWFWHDLSHFMAALGRGQLWWAAGQLEALRRYCVNLARIEAGVEAQEEAYEKLDLEISTAGLSSLRSTFCPMEEGAMLGAALDIVGFIRDRAPGAARAHGLAYPVELERLLCDRLEALAAD
jgi:hypothetical protein